MNDPWDVKSVRQPNQYVSCMKINGVPLLPPVLSKECRQEMEYYKILAKEVEKRISILKPYVSSTFNSTENITDVPELLECEQANATPPEDAEDDHNVTIDKVTSLTTNSSHELSNIDLDSPESHVTKEKYKSVTSNVIVKTTEASLDSSNFVIDLSLCINQNGRNIVQSVNAQQVSKTRELPERDYESPKKIKKEITDNESQGKKIQEFDFVDRNDIPFHQDGPSSLSSKSFTGSLYDIHTDSMKELQLSPKLIRQSSYTVLTPSPQLLAHLKIQSINTGVEMERISMSDSFSNLDSPNNKKRRSWDLESAKEQWSSMALELKGDNFTDSVKTNDHTSRGARFAVRKDPKSHPQARARSLVPDKTRRSSLTTKPYVKSEPIKTKTVPGQVKTVVSKQSMNKTTVANSNRRIENEPVSPTHRSKETPTKQSKEPASPKKSPLASISDDPASRVRELYEKIQNQQLVQMANLVEKQKREQMLLQQVFEEQNAILFKQLKTICPKSPIEVKMAWGDKLDEERGPVSLSQVINHKSPEKTMNPVSNTLTKTNNYISHCDDVLKKSRDITSNIKKQTPKTRSSIGPQRQEVNEINTSSPPTRNTSRKLNYDTSFDREYEPILTDRTNDTLADVNVTFPSDSDDYQDYGNNNTPHNMFHKELAQKQCIVSAPSSAKCRSTDNAIRCLEDSIQHSMNTMSISHTIKPVSFHYQPSAQEREAATKIVAYAKGWLVRRLMKTERVQATVQTIRDALLCALQLHQDREGIRGADVDLHRRLIQQITAACYTLHDTFVASSPADRCAIIASDRERRRSIASRQPTPRSHRYSDIMSQSHSGSFPTRNKRATTTSASLMTQSNYETFNGDKCPASRARYMPSPRRRPWR